MKQPDLFAQSVCKSPFCDSLPFSPFTELFSSAVNLLKESIETLKNTKSEMETLVNVSRVCDSPGLILIQNGLIGETISSEQVDNNLVDVVVKSTSIVVDTKDEVVSGKDTENGLVEEIAVVDQSTVSSASAGNAIVGGSVEFHDGKENGNEGIVKEGDSVRKVEVLGDNVKLIAQVKGSLTGVGKGVDMGRTGNQAMSGDQVNGSRDWLLDDDQNGENGEEGKEMDEDGHEQEEEEEEEGEKAVEVDDQGHEFSIGDFVWGKIKSHPWWPGQIYDPSDALTDAAKYRRRNGRLLVVYFGDGSFARCYPSQLKPFQENFSELAEQSNSKSFLKAVEEAVEEIGRRIELEMTCSCVQLDTQTRLTRPLAVNAGIKEGVAVPEGGNGKLSVSQFEPADFLERLRHIAVFVSVNDVLELSVFRSRLSAFYCIKGYSQLPICDESQYITDLERNAGNEVLVNSNFEGQTIDVTVTPAEEDWLSSPVGPWLRGTGLTQNWLGISEDKLYHRKKQRSMTELMAWETNLRPDEKGSHVGEEGPGSDKQTLTRRRRRENKDSGVRNGFDVAEELNLSSKRIAASVKKNKTTESEVGNDRDIGQTLRKINKTKGSEVGADGAAEGLTVSSQTTRSSRKRNKNKDSEVQNEDGATEELTASGTRTRALSKRNKIKDAEVGNGNDIAEELTVSGNRTRASRTQNKAKDSEGEELTVSGNERRSCREKNKTKYSEIGNNGGLVQDLENMENETRAWRKRSKADYTEDGSDSGISGEEIPRSSRKEKDREDGKDNNMPGEASPSKKQKKSELSESPHVTSEINASDAKKNGVDTNEGIKSGMPLRERRKSKYLSPPYTNPGRGLKSSLSMKNPEMESPRVVKVSYIDELIGKDDEHTSKDAVQFTAFPTLAQCSGENVQKNLLKESELSQRMSPRKPKENQGKAVIKGDDSPVTGLLIDLRCAAVKPLHHVNRQTYEPITGFFKRFRNSFCHDGSDFVIYSEYLSGRGSRKRISLDAKDCSPGKETEKADHLTSQGKPEQKKRKRQEGQNMNSKKSKTAVGTSDEKMNDNGEANGEISTAALLLTFAPWASLPSKDELISKFVQFGAVRLSEAEVLGDSNCAQIVFVKSSDAEEAYNNLEKSSPFGSSVASYRLRYLPASSRAIDQAVSQEPAKGEVSSLLSVRQSLEITTSVLEKSWDRLSSEVKAKLENNIKGLLDKVNSVVESSSH